MLHHEPPFIGLEPGASLRTPGEVFSIRRIERRHVGAGTGGNFLWRATAHRHGENFVVRTGRFHLVNVRSVSELLTVRRNRIHILPAKMKRRDVMIAWGEIAWCRGGRAGRSLI